CGVVHEGNIFWMDDRGLASCAETKTGALVFQERTGIEGGSGASRAVYASTVMAGSHFFSVTRRQGTVVWKASKTFEKVAINRFEGDTTDFNASPAIAGDQVFLRSNQAIYCLGN
ncbi:MAG: serine/threonine protein kinase, partial [Planctomycetia bacterium]